MRSILLCMAFLASYVTVAYAMEEIGIEEMAAQPTRTTPDEKKVQEFLKKNIEKILQNEELVYEDGNRKWNLKCSLNVFKEAGHHNKESSCADVISSSSITLYPLISCKDDDGLQNVCNISNYLAIIKKEEQLLLHLILNKVN
jgi:hypothetical protein